MVYLTGDTHNEFTRLSNKYFKKYDLEIGENDYIIVCGDLGLCWSKDKTFEWNCKWFAEKPYTLLWVQGNHENYDMIDTNIQLKNGMVARYVTLLETR